MARGKKSKYVPETDEDESSEVSNITDHNGDGGDDDDDEPLSYEEWARRQAIKEEEQARLEAIAREDLKQKRENAARLKAMIFLGSCIICLLIGLIVVLAITLANRFNENSGDASGAITASPTIVELPVPTTTPTFLEPTRAPVDTLAAIKEEGVLRCGIPELPGFAEFNSRLNTYIGFDADLCRAVAAAIFGTAEGHVDFTVVDGYDRFRQLNNGAFDVMARITTLTMERQVLEVSSHESEKLRYGGYINRSLTLCRIETSDM